MPVRMVFRCEFCDARPDDATQRTLEGQLRQAAFGEYLDAPCRSADSERAFRRLQSGGGQSW